TRSTIRWSACGNGYHCGRPDILSGTLARAHCGTLLNAGRQAILIHLAHDWDWELTMSTLVTEPQTTPQIPPDDPTSLLPKRLARSRLLFDPELVNRAVRASFGKLNPITLLKNPVMFVVEVGAALTTIFLIRDLVTGAPGLGFQFQIALWLWFTVLFANFA